ncbi:MAG: hypothetical protein AB7F19_06275 [Candidatus Babeliales bacterium]
MKKIKQHVSYAALIMSIIMIHSAHAMHTFTFDADKQIETYTGPTTDQRDSEVASFNKATGKYCATYRGVCADGDILETEYPESAAKKKFEQLKLAYMLQRKSLVISHGDNVSEK